MCFPQDLDSPGQPDQTHPDEGKPQQEYASQEQPDVERVGHSEDK